MKVTSLILICSMVFTLLSNIATVNVASAEVKEVIKIPGTTKEYTIKDKDGNSTLIIFDFQKGEAVVEVVNPGTGLKEKKVLGIQKDNFSDLDGHWAKADIQLLVSLGLIKGYPDGTFRPDKPISRAEYATLLTRVIEFVQGEQLQMQQKDSFADVHDTDWFYDFIRKLELRGNLNVIHYPSALLQPNSPIPREEMAAWLAAEIEKQGDSLAFSDMQQISYVDEVTTVTYAGLIYGYPDGTFRPKGHSTRAEAVSVMIRYLKYKGLIE